MLGMPCLVYPLALEGFLDVLDDLVIIAEEPQAFADRLVELLSDANARKRLSDRGLAETLERLSNRELIDFFQHLSAA